VRSSDSGPFDRPAAVAAPCRRRQAQRTQHQYLNLGDRTADQTTNASFQRIPSTLSPLLLRCGQRMSSTGQLSVQWPECFVGHFLSERRETEGYRDSPGPTSMLGWLVGRRARLRRKFLTVFCTANDEKKKKKNRREPSKTMGKNGCTPRILYARVELEVQDPIR